MPKLKNRQKRVRQIEDKQEKPKVNLTVRSITPITENQIRVFKEFYNDQHLFLHGYPGTGKSWVSIYLALEQILSGLATVDKLIIIRSAVQTRQQGFLPGNHKEKMGEHELAYEAIINDLCEKDDAYRLLKSKHIIEFTSTSFLRSVTYNDAIILFDECQNATFHELDTVMTRVGKNTRLILSGDIRQVDLDERREKSGIADFMEIMKRMKWFSFVEFGVNDIVRSAVVKNYIKTKLALIDQGVIHQ